MRINAESDYALRIMRVLVAREGLTGAQQISEAARVPQRFTVKILRKLVSCGLVTSKKGAYGGYSLSKPAADISMLEVIEAVSGPISISKCLCEGFVCEQGGEGCSCTYNRIFDELNIMIAEKLGAITLDKV